MAEHHPLKKQSGELSESHRLVQAFLSNEGPTKLNRSKVLTNTKTLDLTTPPFLFPPTQLLRVGAFYSLVILVKRVPYR